MNRTLRMRNKKLDVQLTAWKLLPVFFMVLLFLLSASLSGANATSGAAPPRFD